MSDKITLYLDAGHGAIDPETCEYTTAPAKMYDHGSDYTFHEFGKFYEGVFNRQVADRVEEKAIAKGFNVVKLYHEYIDTPLSERTKKANRLYQLGHRGVLFSLHGNAGKGTGIEIFTSVGDTGASDKIAEKGYELVVERIPEMKFRADTRDSDHDKEADFWMLRKSAMPATLWELGFFDNPKDAEMMNSVSYQDKIADIVVDCLVYANEIMG